MTASDCGGARWQCTPVEGRRICVVLDTWITGSGTWDYLSDHFEWPISGMRFAPGVTCGRGRSTSWHADPVECVAVLYGQFDAPEGGLDYATVVLVINGSTPINTPVLGRVSLTTNATAADHAGSVSETLDEVVFTSIDLQPGGIASGTWQIAGTVGVDNLLAASGEFRVTFPE